MKGSLGPLARAVDELEQDYETLKVAYHELEKDNDKLAEALREAERGDE